MTIIEKLGITPGPWEVDGYTSEDTDFSVCTKREMIHSDKAGKADWIAELCSDNTSGGFATTEKNLHLIAAAPEMLGALIEYCLLMEGDLLEASLSVWQVRTMSSLCSKYVAIIEKIRGETWGDIKEIIGFPRGEE